MRTSDVLRAIRSSTEMRVPRYFIDNLVARGTIAPRLDENGRRIFSAVELDIIRRFAERQKRTKHYQKGP